MLAVRVCGCGAVLDEECCCGTCGPARAWRVVADGVTVAAAGPREGVMLDEGFQGSLRAGLAAAPEDVPRYTVLLPRRRR